MLKTVCLAILVLAGRVSALDARRGITQFTHTSWTEKDGAPENARALAQTTDGYLWIGTATGLFYFDGVRFVRFDPPGEALPPTPIRGMLATRGGSLWVTLWNGGLSRVRKGHVTSYSQRDGMPGAFSIAEGSDGSLIAGTNDGLRIFRNDRWEAPGKEWMLPGKSVQQVYYDRGGTLWVVTDDRVVYLPPGSHSFIDPDEKVPPLPARYKFAQAPGGEVWLALTSRSAHVVRRTREEKDRGTEVRVGASSMLFDRSGSMWIGSAGDGLRRVRFPERIRGIHVARFGPEAEAYTVKDGLSGDTVFSLLEDREGNIWCATGHGIDRFRERPFVPVAIAQSETMAFIQGTADGLLWTFSLSGGVSYVAPDGTQKVISGEPMLAAAEDRSGGVWTVAGELDRVPGGGEQARARFFHSAGRKLAEVHLRDAALLKNIRHLTIDGAGTLWLLDSQRGLSHLAGGHFNSVLTTHDHFDTEGVLFADHHERIWVGQADRIVLWANGTSRSFESADGVPAGQIYTFHEDAAGNIWVGGEAGISKFDGGRFRFVPGQTGQHFNSVNGVAEDRDGFWWLASDLGILRMPAGELDRALADPAHPARYTLFNSFDGLPGKPRHGYPAPVIARTTDGRIWFVTTHGLAWVDPRSLRKNDIPPPVVVEAVRVNGKPVTLTADNALPPSASDIEIDYTALSLTIPERVLFRYKLEGAEKDWREAGTRRQAYYGRLDPGHYRFRVIACNNDGVWNEAGAIWDFSVAPAFYQRIWFQLLCALAASLLAAAAYHIRVRQIAASLNARFDERLAERTRIAREFHDTLLQTIQGSKLVADDALETTGDAARMRGALERLSQWLGQAVDEGRLALSSLRTSTTEGNDLAEALLRAGGECRFQRAIEFDLSVEGSGREMHPIVRHEVYRIGHEAIRNACTHSEASRVALKLSYLDDLILSVRDNGKGFNPNQESRSSDGHFGIVGMQERASRIRGKLTIASAPGTGTEVKLTVPHGVVFRR